MRGTRLERPAAGRWRGVDALLQDRRSILLVALMIAAVAAALEIGLEGRDPFWLDESWTGGIIGQPTWRETFHQIYSDVNAPLYYVVMRLWSGLFGLSDLALRAPSLICAAAIPVAAALVPAPGLTRAQRAGWAAVLAWWFPTLCYAQEARCYALLLLVCTLQTLAFMRLMAAPGLGRAALWAAIAATAILTHYDALYLGAAQGLLYLARHHVRAVRTWPAALAFAPAFGWLAYHWPRIAQFARPEIAWYTPLRPSALPAIAGYIAGGGELMLGWPALVLVTSLSLRLLPMSEARTVAAPEPSTVGWAAAAAGIAAAVLVAIGFLRPSFTFRYLTPSAPGLLLALVWLAGRLAGRRWASAAIALTAAAYLGVGSWMLAHHLRMAPKRYNFEAASAALARSRPSQLVFLWDHPVDPILLPEQLSALGGFFLHRSGLQVPVTPVVLRPGEDPNSRLISQAGAPGSAILWVYDTAVKGSAAITHPPRIDLLTPAFACRQFGSGRFGVLACRAQGDAAAPRLGAASEKAHQRGGITQPHGSP